MPSGFIQGSRFSRYPATAVKDLTGGMPGSKSKWRARRTYSTINRSVAALQALTENLNSLVTATGTEKKRVA
jgi:hypothetical protein